MAIHARELIAEIEEADSNKVHVEIMEPRNHRRIYLFRDSRWRLVCGLKSR